MASDPTDTALRRFLERATEDPVDNRVDTLVELAPRRIDSPRRRPAGRRLMLAAAAVVLVGAGVALAARERPVHLVAQPAASTESDGANHEVPPTTSGPGTGGGTPAPPASAGPPTTVEGVGRVMASPPTIAGSGEPTTAAPAGSGSGSSSGSSPTTSVAPATSALATSVPTTSAPSPASPSTRLRLSLDSVLAGAGAGVRVLPAVGPALAVDQVGTGTIEAVPGGGRRFRPGGQQRTDYAVVSRIGADVGALVPAAGRATVVFVPQVDVAGRTVPTGRNIHTWFEIVSQEGPSNLVTGVLLQVDPEIGPYLAGAIQGVGFEYTLTPADVAELGRGRVVTLSLQWTATTGRLVLNDRTLTEVALPASSISWTSTARLSIGGSASWGGGYFAAHDDAIRSFEINAR